MTDLTTPDLDNLTPGEWTAVPGTERAYLRVDLPATNGTRYTWQGPGGVADLYTSEGLTALASAAGTPLVHLVPDSRLDDIAASCDTATAATALAVARCAGIDRQLSQANADAVAARAARTNIAAEAATLSAALTTAQADTLAATTRATAAETSRDTLKYLLEQVAAGTMTATDALTQWGAQQNA